MLTIGLIDDFMISRLGLTILITNYYDDVLILEANNIQDYAILHNQQTPDMIILGNNYNQDEKSMAAVRQLKKSNPETPLIVYDDNLLLNLTIPYFRIGISGYLLRRHTAEEMLPCIQAISNQKRYLSPALTDQLLISLGISYKKREPQQKSILTRRELEIAGYVVQGLKTSQISVMLDRKASTVSSIKHNIFKKLNVKSVNELLEAFSEFPF